MTISIVPGHARGSFPSKHPEFFNAIGAIGTPASTADETPFFKRATSHPACAECLPHTRQTKYLRPGTGDLHRLNGTFAIRAIDRKSLTKPMP
jgi:hypothetical protein